MRIYQVDIEHKKWGRNFGSEKVAADTFQQAIRKVGKLLRSSERIESVTIVADTD